MKNITACYPDPSQITFSDKVLGGLCLGSFVFVWLSSAASPFLFIYAIVSQQYVFALFIVLITLIAYAPWKPGYWVIRFRRFMNYYSTRYFQKCHLVFQGDHLPSAEKDPPTLYSIHPHGAFSMGWAMFFCHDVMQHVTFCFSPFLYTTPFFRLFSRCTGNPGSAARKDMISYMKKGRSLALPPGGFEEATITYPKQDRVFLKKRTGFIKLCLQHGMAVRPVYAFGEKSLFWNIQGMFSLRLALNRHGIPAILTWGDWAAPLLPKRNVDLHVVCGPPIQLPRIENPTKEEVQKWHDAYTTALIKLFDEYKETAYGPEVGKTAKLEIW